MSKASLEIWDFTRRATIGTSVVTILCLATDFRLLSTAAAAGNKAHQHGAGELNIAIEGHDLLVDVRLPAKDVVGFEHPPANAEQKARVQEAFKQFSTPGRWFELPADAKCEIESAQATMVGLAMDEGDQDHSSKHEHEHQKSGKDTDHAEIHSDFEGTIEFHCDNPTRLTSLTAGLFTALKNLSGLTVQFVGPSLQTRSTLTRKNNSLNLKP